MNTLSWMIYLADVIPAVGAMFIVFAGLTVMAGIGFVIYGGTERESAYFDVVGTGPDARKRARETQRWQDGYGLQKRAFKLIPVVGLLVLVAVLIPGRSTFLMIAASEMGETVVKTPEAQEIFNDLRLILKKQLEEAKK